MGMGMGMGSRRIIRMVRGTETSGFVWSESEVDAC